MKGLLKFSSPRGPTATSWNIVKDGKIRSLAKNYESARTKENFNNLLISL